MQGAHEGKRFARGADLILWYEWYVEQGKKHCHNLDGVTDKVRLDWPFTDSPVAEARAKKAKVCVQ
jgi:hypothetical protein